MFSNAPLLIPIPTWGFKFAQVLIGRPALIPAQGVFLRLVAEVPNLIHPSRQRVELQRGSGILNAVAVCAYHVDNNSIKESLIYASFPRMRESSAP